MRRKRKKRHYKDRRRRRLLTERRNKIKSIIAVAARSSEDGIAIPVNSDGSPVTQGHHPAFRVLCNQHGLLKWSRKAIKEIVKPWNNLSACDLKRLESWQWAPRKPKHALQLLAECAGSFR